MTTLPVRGTRIERLRLWPGWKLVGAIANACIVLVVFYIGYTVHQHNAQIACLTTSINQALNEAFHHAHIAPPICKG